MNDNRFYCRPGDEFISAETLRAYLRYDPETGKFTRLIHTSNRIRIGNDVGSLHPSGYLKIRVAGSRPLMAHRLAWLYMHGRWPIEFIDHVNGNRSDNRIENLREADAFINAQNTRCARKDSKTGIQGIGPWGNKWRATLRIDGRAKHLGLFESAGAAHAAYLQAKRIHHPGAVL